MFANRQFWDELAVQSYKAILKTKPDSAIIHTNLGLAYVRMGRHNKAVRCFQRAVKCNGHPPEAYYHMGTALQILGKRKEAIRAFSSYTKLAGSADKGSGIVPDLIEKLRSENEQSQ